MIEYSSEQCGWFTHTLRAWFLKNGRHLPWRNHPTPYQVWVSEIMLQQTQVVTVIPYYERWMKLFPNVESLASAAIDDVLKLWAGLGYYRRARYLYEGAKVIVEQYHGEFPADIRELRKIPGIGAYTAGAIAAFAFKQDVPAIDGNAERVLSRFFGIQGDIRGAERGTLEGVANEVASFGHCSDVNQAIMDLGASLCGKSAQCAQCPIAEKCYAFEHKMTELLPAPKVRIEKTDEFRVALRLTSPNGRILIAQRSKDALLGGLWEYPMVTLSRGKGKSHQEKALKVLEQSRNELWIAWCQQNQLHLTHWGTTRQFVKHTFTHIQMRVDLDEGVCDSMPIIAPNEDYEDFRWVEYDDIGKKYPISTLMKKMIGIGG
ncbi:MAG: A/G-specific adenine glycosylase [Proteobacteria bacterium]|nr:A/G-specific adenine glycosylase [Pseudomonadota bacterium]